MNTNATSIAGKKDRVLLCGFVLSARAADPLPRSGGAAAQKPPVIFLLNMILSPPLKTERCRAPPGLPNESPRAFAAKKGSKTKNRPRL
jgi:hypothetical protein